MVEYATAECATCHAIRPMNEMREVRVKRLSSVSQGSGRSSRSGNGRSSSFGGGSSARFGSTSSNSQRSHSNSRSHYRVNDVWVCVGCKAPRSDTEWGGIGTIIVLAFVAFLLWNIWGGRSRTVSDTPGAPTASLAGSPSEAPLDASRLVPSATDNQQLRATGLASDEDIGKLDKSDEVSDGSDLKKTVASRQIDQTNEDREEEDAKAIAEQKDFCSHVTDEGRRNVAYMVSVGC